MDAIALWKKLFFSLLHWALMALHLFPEGKATNRLWPRWVGSILMLPCSFSWNRLVYTVQFPWSSEFFYHTGSEAKDTLCGSPGVEKDVRRKSLCLANFPRWKVSRDHERSFIIWTRGLSHWHSLPPHHLRGEGDVWSSCPHWSPWCVNNNWLPDLCQHATLPDVGSPLCSVGLYCRVQVMQQ